MPTVGSHETKAPLPQRLERVEHGETISITCQGKPVARLVPSSEIPARPDVSATIAAMAEFQEREASTLGGKVVLRGLIDEGRR